MQEELPREKERPRIGRETGLGHARERCAYRDVRLHGCRCYETMMDSVGRSMISEPQDYRETDQRCRIRDNLYCMAETRRLL